MRKQTYYSIKPITILLHFMYVFILYGFHTLVNLCINLKPVIMICKYSAGCLCFTCRQRHVTSCQIRHIFARQASKVKASQFWRVRFLGNNIDNT